MVPFLQKNDSRFRCASIPVVFFSVDGALVAKKSPDFCRDIY